MRRTTTLLLALAFAAMALPAAAQRRPACPRIPSVSSDPLNRGYKAGDVVPAELLDPPFAWAECPPPVAPVGAMRTAQPRVVFLSVTVDEAGAVADARPRGAIDPEGYYEAAVAALRNWRTGAPRWRGLKVKASIAVDVSFARAESPATEQPAAATALPPAASTAPAPSAPTAAPAAAPTTAPASVQSTPPAVPPLASAAPTAQPTTPPVTRAPESTPQPVAAAQPPRTASATETPRATPLATQQPAPMPAPAQMQTPPASAPPVTRTEMRIEPSARMETPERNEARTQPPVTQPSQARAGAEPFVVEYYYKVKWGYAEEFWHLFNRNHWPLLQRQIQMGRILEVRAAKPRYHATEDGRWDYRVTIIFRSAAEANAPFDTEALERQLFPDFDTYRREERHRFELLLAHWDVPITPADLEP